MIYSLRSRHTQFWLSALILLSSLISGIFQHAHALDRRFQQALKPFGISTALVKNLDQMGVKSISVLRQRLHSRDKKFLTRISDSDVVKLRQASIFLLLSDNIKLNAGLAKRKIQTLKDLDGLSADELIQASDSTITKQDAQVYKKRVKGLLRIVSSTSRNIRKHFANPPLLYIAQPISQELKTAVQNNMRGPEETCDFECNEQNNIFSPAVYVLYLLDFVEKSFGDQFGNLDKIERRFQQNFRASAISRKIDQQDSYVQYTNMILENFIAAVNPNDNINDDLYKLVNEPARRSELQKIYDQFHHNAYKGEPGFRALVLADLFESYVRELGTTPAEVRFILKGSPNLQAQFADQHNVLPGHLANMSGPANPADTKLEDLETVKKVIEKSLHAQEKEAVEEEYIEQIMVETEAEFRKTYLTQRAAAIDETFDSLMKIFEGDPNKYPPQFERDLFEPLNKEPGSTDESKDLYDWVLFAARETAKQCVNTGEPCPENSPWKEKPFNYIKELYRAYPGFIPSEYKPATPGTDISEDAFKQLGRIRAIEHCRTFEEQVMGGESRLSLLLNDENQWKPDYNNNPPTCNSLAGEGNLPQRSLKFAEQRLYEVDGIENELQLRAISKGKFEAASKAAFNTDYARRADKRYDAVLSRAEQGFLEQIRTNLAALALRKTKDYYERLGPLQDPPFTIEEQTSGGITAITLPKNIERLGNSLFLDLSIEQTQRTTPLSFVISRLHSFVQAVRLGTIKGISADNLDEKTWEWLQSYGTWHAAMMVSAYPENFLFPELRYNRTSQFKTAFQAGGDNIEKIVSIYSNEVDRLRGLDLVETILVDNQIFLFAAGQEGDRVNDDLHYSVIDGSGKWQPWQKLSATGSNMRFGSIQAISFDNYIYLFTLFSETRNPYVKQKVKLKFIAFPRLGASLELEDNSTPDTSEEITKSNWEDTGVEWEHTNRWQLMFACAGPDQKDDDSWWRVLCTLIDKDAGNVHYNLLWINRGQVSVHSEGVKFFAASGSPVSSYFNKIDSVRPRIVKFGARFCYLDSS